MLAMMSVGYGCLGRVIGGERIAELGSAAWLIDEGC